MAEVVGSLCSVLNLQEKTNSSLKAAGKSIFGRMMHMLPFPSNAENSGNISSKPSSNSNGNTRNDGDAVGADNKDFTDSMPSLEVFMFADLKRATKDFCQDLLLGRGSYGEVFIAWVDKDTFAPSTEDFGVAVAVKRYSDDLLPEWQRNSNIKENTSTCDDVSWEVALQLICYDMLRSG
ncbi:hypothetical protein L1887_38821 [Cichorium endivia]|nr:hypothetical protein L1887_38821 [Cichorium endivia]